MQTARIFQKLIPSSVYLMDKLSEICVSSTLLTISLQAKVFSHGCSILFWLSDYFLLGHTVAQ